MSSAPEPEPPKPPSGLIARARRFWEVPFEQLPIRWRLAVTSATLTFVILCAFAVAVGTLTANRIHSDFNHQISEAATELVARLGVTVDRSGHITRVEPNLDTYAAPEHAVVRVLGVDGSVLLSTTKSADLGPPVIPNSEFNGYRVETRTDPLTTGGSAFVQYARPFSDVNSTIARVRLFLLFGVFGGTALALLAGLMIARRAMAPIAQLTAAGREIARTRDPRASVPKSNAEDEVAELARTLDEMLRSLAAARAETEGMLVRQREFVADASHELRTPLTSVLANLELLAETLDGDQGEAARSALRSSRRMRRLVADLLLLARADIGRVAPSAPLDLADVALEAASELEPVSNEHELMLDAQLAPVEGVRDELHRLVVNLVENALNHTPPRTRVRIATGRQDGQAFVSVEDDGPGIPTELRERLFERFVRGQGDVGGSFGLGLAIVRSVAESHGGDVTLSTPASGRGARFVVHIPARPGAPEPQPVAAAGEAPSS